MDYSKIRPLFDRVLVQRIEEQRSSGLIVTSTPEDSPLAKVIKLGDGRRTEHEYKTLPFTVKEGDIVYIKKYSGIALDSDYLVIKEEEIVGIVA